MAAYRHKPVPIDAVRWFKIGDHPSVIIWGNIFPAPYCQSPRGFFFVHDGDWIATDESGSWPIRPKDFALKYEPA